jgi:hypothetical protein
MSIDTSIEHLIPLPQAGRLPWLDRVVPAKTVYRWAKTGIGGIRLETVRSGGRLATTSRAVLEFIERLSDPVATQETVPASRQAKAHDQARAFLASEGLSA